MGENKICIRVKFSEEILSQRLNYVLNFIENHPLCINRLTFHTGVEAQNDIVLNYGCQGSDSIFMPANLFLFTDKVKTPVKLYTNKYLWKDGVIYDISEVLNDGLNNFFENSQVGFDVFETIFFHLSRIEEIWMENSCKESGYWMREDDLLLIRENIYDVPVVDHLVVALMQVMGIYPQEKLTEFVLTHDIDKIYKYNSIVDGMKAAIWPVIFRKSLIDGFKNLYYFVKVWLGRLKDPYDSFHFLLNKENFWKEKIIFFMAGGKSNFDLFDKFYQRDFHEILEIANYNGYITGLHPSYYSGSDETMFLKEIEFLEGHCGHEVVHSRQHWLRFFHNITPSMLEKYDIKTDHTLGYARNIGFRCGTGFEFNLYHFEDERPYVFKSRPLIIMDSALIHYCREDMDRFSQILEDFLSKNLSNTCITFNFHNSTFDYTLGERKKIEKIYLKMIDKVKEQFLLTNKIA